MSAAPPPFAATLLDYSYPASLPVFEPIEVWVAFLNVGSEVWPVGQVWLESQTAATTGRSPLYVESEWAAWDMAAVTQRDVHPQEVGIFRFSVGTQRPFGNETGDVFRIRGPEGELLNCPSPEISMQMLPGYSEEAREQLPRTSEDGAHADVLGVSGHDPQPVDMQGECTCRLARRAPAGARELLVLLALLMAVAFRRPNS